MSVGDCIFCKIVSGSIPSHRVLETDSCLAFLDAAPLAPGHCLLIPKQHYTTLEELPEDVAAAVLGQLPALGRAVRAVTGAAGYNVLQNTGRVAGQEVMHVHVHVIPRVAGDGLGYRWHTKSLEDAAAEALRNRIAAALRG
ncbi:MAG: HIT family protein [bacterium]|nr:HIT family protein [bacterium]